MLRPNRFASAAIAAMLLLPYVASPVLAQGTAPAPAQPAPVSSTDSETLTAIATVTAIDTPARKVTVLAGDGRKFTVTAGPDVRNFDQIKLGDNVVATLELAVTYTLFPKGSKVPTMAGGGAVARAKKGEKPGAAVVKSVSLTGVIIGVDVAAKTITLVEQGGGAVHTVKVKNPERQAYLPKVQPGDLLTVTYTEGFALTVTPAAK